MTGSRGVSPMPQGAPVPGWQTKPRPPRTAMVGRYCRVEPLEIARHAADLYDADRDDPTGWNWTYLSSDAPPDAAAYRSWLARMSAEDDPLFHAIVDATSGRAVGVAAYLRIEPVHGVIEVGHLNFSPRLQRRTAATEAMCLMFRRVFDELGYRRCEWKCDSLNAASRASAERLGFTFEGIFRQAMVYKGRNRDTAWFSTIDSEWPGIRRAFEQWLDPANFDAGGRQQRSLRELMPKRVHPAV